MKLTAEDLVASLAAVSGEEPADRAETVAALRSTQASFAPTIYSAWAADGDQLNPGLRHDVEAARARVAYYRSVAADLSSQVPELIPIKGLQVAELYPDGFVRAMNDLDYVALAEQDLWRAVAALVRAGWDIDTATFSRILGELHIMVSMRRPHEDPYQLPYGVEVASYFALGNLGGIGPLLRLATDYRKPQIKNLLMLLYERFEQPFRARDLVDATLLVASFDPGDAETLGRGIAELGLSAEYAELARLVKQAGFDALPMASTRSWGPHLTRARRAARSASFFQRPLTGTARHLQRRLVAGTSGRADRWLSALVAPRLPVIDAVNGGLLAFGLPLDGDAPDVAIAEMHSRGELAWVDTPVARFLLTIGDDVSEAAVEELTILRADGEVVVASPVEPGV